MSGKKDIVKGRVQEAAGVLTGNDELRSKGRTNQAIGRVKQAASVATEKVVKRLRK